MTKLLEASRLALEAFSDTDSEHGSKQWYREVEALEALDKAIAEAEQAEPVGEVYRYGKDSKGSEWDCTCSGKFGCLERFADLVRADEREACAKVCEDVEMKNTRHGPADCAAAIRARGEMKGAA